VSQNQEIKNIWFNGVRMTDLEYIIKKKDEEGSILENLYKYGLPKNINKEALIAVCCKNDNPRRTHFHEFKPLSRNFIKFNINNCKYDIPFYIHNVPEHFSLFESITEIIEVKKYNEKKNDNNDSNNNNNSNNSNNDENIENTKLSDLPLPAENHNYCFLCKSRFDEYLSHIEGDLHKKNYNKNKKNFNKIKDTLKRIGNYYDGKKEKIENNFVDDDDDDEYFVDINATNNSNINLISENKRERLYNNNNIHNKKQKENFNNNISNTENNNYNTIKKLFDKKCKYNVSQTNTSASSQNSQNIKSINIISTYLKNIKKKK
jgi:hypothetical protein